MRADPGTHHGLRAGESSSRHAGRVSRASQPAHLPDWRVWELLEQAHHAYTASNSPAYDEVLHEVADRIRGAGSIGKADIGALPRSR